jgi:hypothetical protein
VHVCYIQYAVKSVITHAGSLLCCQDGAVWRLHPAAATKVPWRNSLESV